MPGVVRRTGALMGIYFIREDDQGPIKIGMAKDPERRLRVLQTGNHKRLRMIAIVPGGRSEEAALHRRFQDLRIEKTEWFQPVERLLGFVEGLRYAAELLRAPSARGCPPGESVGPELV